MPYLPEVSPLVPLDLSNLPFPYDPRFPSINLTGLASFMPPVRKDLSKLSPCPSLPTPYKSISGTDIEMSAPSPPTTVSDSYQAGFSSHSDTDSDASADSMDVEFSSSSDSSSSSDNECPAQYEASLNERFSTMALRKCLGFATFGVTHHASLGN